MLGIDTVVPLGIDRVVLLELRLPGVVPTEECCYPCWIDTMVPLEVHMATEECYNSL